MTWISDDTKTLNAVFYLDDQGNEQTRDDLLEEMWHGYKVWMVFLGCGYVPLTLAAPGDYEGEAYEAGFVQALQRRMHVSDHWMIRDVLDIARMHVRELAQCEQCKPGITRAWKTKCGIETT